MQLKIHDYGLVVLIGPAGSGKTTFAARCFRPSEVLSSDHYRSVVGDEDRNATTTKDAFDVIETIAARRLRSRRLCVIDATNVSPDDRKRYVQLARDEHAPLSAIAFDLPERDCITQNAARGAEARPQHAVRRQWRSMQRWMKKLSAEGFRRRYRLRSPEDARTAEIVREPLSCDRRDLAGPFDVIGDVHGCREELEALLAELGYRVERNDTADGPGYGVTPPAGRTAVFVGDLVDRGPDSAGALALVMDMAAAGHALAIPGNHDAKLARALAGREVECKHGLAQTLEQLEATPESFRTRAAQFLDGLASHYVLDGDRLVVAHAGMKERLQNRTSRQVRDFGLYGETTGETDDDGLPVRLDWAADYRGRAAVIYGHTPAPRAEWVNETICIDTGCAFGGRLTALRWPERKLVSVPANKTYAEPSRAFSTALQANAGRTRQQESDALLDIDDVTGPLRLHTRIAGPVSVRPENCAAALDTMARFAVDPRWLVYLPPTMAPCASTTAEDLLERPAEAFGYFRARGIRRVMCEEKHMGSRAVIVVGRTAAAAEARFGVESHAGGIVYTRTGRRFFDDNGIEQQVLDQIRAGLDAAGAWNGLDTEWAVIDTEIMPWSAKGGGLIRDHYEPAGAAARIGLREATAALRRAATGSTEIETLLHRFEQRTEMTARYEEAYRRYNWPTEGIDGLKVAPFHLLATEGAVHADKPHRWHMDVTQRMCAAGGILTVTEHREVNVDNESETADAARWWTERTESGAEGMVVKPEDFITRTERGVAAPALKCRGREYLRIIYGPEYTSPDQLERLRRRNTGRKMTLALREFALGIEALEQFVGRAPLRNVHRNVFAILALEAEPTDPRL
jgi:protein phosphatase